MKKILISLTMKRLSYFLLASIIFMGYACDKDKVDDNVITGDYPIASDYRVKRMVEYSSSNSDRESMGVEYSYDKNGNLVKKSYYVYYPSTVLYMYREYEYSGNKMMRENVFNGAVPDLTLGLYSIFHYTNDNLTKEEVFRGYDNSFVYSINYEYDSRNNLIHVIYQYEDEDGDGDAIDLKYVYNDKNQLIIEENSTVGPEEYKYIKHIYDEKDREIKLEYCNIDWQLLYYVSKIYENDSSNPSEEIWLDNDNSQKNKYSHYYDKWNNLTETVINDNCSLFRRTYNGELLIEAINYSLIWGCSETGMTRYEYEKK